MTDASPLLDRKAIEEAFRRLGERLAGRGVVADIYVFGGAAMALAYDARRSTRDIDAVFEPHGIVLEEAGRVAADLGLPSWWLNEQASVYVAPGGDPSARRVFDHAGLRVSAASPERLLTLKVLAAVAATLMTSVSSSVGWDSAPPTSFLRSVRGCSRTSPFPTGRALSSKTSSLLRTTPPVDLGKCPRAHRLHSNDGASFVASCEP